jgi:hypothetical protein
VRGRRLSCFHLQVSSFSLLNLSSEMETDSAEYRTPSPNAETADPAELPNGRSTQRLRRPSWASVGPAEGGEDSVHSKAEESPDWQGTDL